MKMIVETENLTKRYGSFAVVDQVGMRVPKGKVYGLLGRNGAGKTTLIKMILRLVRPTEGNIRLFGTDCRKRTTEAYRRIGSMIETPGFYDTLSASENLRLLGRLRGGWQAEEISRALKVVGLQDHFSKPFANYSLGMKQRLGLAAAIVHKPELLILDEPMNGLDPVGALEMQSFLMDLCRKEGTTLLISSHILSEIEQMADIVGIMHEGRLIEEAFVTDLQKRKRSHVEMDVSDPDAAVSVLEEKCLIREYVVQGRTLKVFDAAHRCGELNRTLNQNGLIVTRLVKREGSLRDYFCERIGGGQSV